jgi:hypothetical protein
MARYRCRLSGKKGAFMHDPSARRVPSAIRSRRFVTLWRNRPTALLATRRSARRSELRQRSPSLCRRLLGAGCPCRLPRRATDGVRQ